MMTLIGWLVVPSVQIFACFAVATMRVFYVIDIALDLVVVACVIQMTHATKHSLYISGIVSFSAWLLVASEIALRCVSASLVMLPWFLSIPTMIIVFAACAFVHFYASIVFMDVEPPDRFSQRSMDYAQTRTAYLIICFWARVVVILGIILGLSNQAREFILLTQNSMYVIMHWLFVPLG